MTICYQAIEGFGAKTIRCWREGKPDMVVTVTKPSISPSYWVSHSKGLVAFDTPREAGEWVENWLRTYDS